MCPLRDYCLETTGRKGGTSGPGRRIRKTHVPSYNSKSFTFPTHRTHKTEKLSSPSSSPEPFYTLADSHTGHSSSPSSNPCRTQGSRRKGCDTRTIVVEVSYPSPRGGLFPQVLVIRILFVYKSPKRISHSRVDVRWFPRLFQTSIPCTD